MAAGDTLTRFNDISKRKASMPVLSMAILGFMAGAFIALAAQGSTTASAGVSPIGPFRLITGAVFPVGLMLVVFSGAELFTGNSLMTIGVLNRVITPRDLLRNWAWVYASNFAGAVTVALLVRASGVWHMGDCQVGVSLAGIAASKVSMAFGEAVARGILCNWLVCLAVWIAVSAGDAVGKMLGIFFPIMLFVTSGYEHSIADMFYIPAGILAAADPVVASAPGFPAAAGGALTWASFFVKNLLPVTLGNITGGVGLAYMYWVAHTRLAKR